MKLKTSTRVIVIGLVFLSLSLGLSLIFAVSAVDAAVVVKVDPASQTVVNPGDSFSVDVRVDDVTYMAMADADLNFDPGVMQATEIIEGDFLKSAGATVPIEIIDNTAGTATFAYTLMNLGVGASGSGVLATINFDTNSSAEGVFNLDLTNVLLADGNDNDITVDEIINGKVTIGNPPPSKPSKPFGQTPGEIGFSYPYSTMSTDPGGDDVYYWFEWGDSTNSGWIGPYPSGTSGSASNAWSTPDIYDVEAKAKDVYGAESSPLWSELLPVCINGSWESDPNNPCKERKLTCYKTYEYRNKPDGTDCGSDYYDAWEYYCDGDEVRKHRRFHDFYCGGGSCTDHTSWVDNQLVENCSDYDGWYCDGDVREKRDYYCSDGTCNYTVTSPDNCNNQDDCYAYDNGCEDRDYYCSGGSCVYTYSNRSTDYYDAWEYYCKVDLDEVWKHRRFHDFYCGGGACTDHTSWKDEQKVEDCNNYDGCYAYDNGCEDRDYYCSGGSCAYTYSNRSTDYYEDGASYCEGDEVWKHRRFHDFYCDGGTCTENISWVDNLVENCNDYDGWHCNGDVREYRDYYCSEGNCTYTVTSSENCNDYDGWVDTGDTRWIDEPGNECREKEQRKREYRDYACSGGSCTYSVTNTQWIDTGETRNKLDGTDCGSDYYEDWASYCEGDEVWKHRWFHDFYCDGGTCTEHTSWVDDQLVENCNNYDGWHCNGDVREYRDYYCSGGSCTYTVTSSENCNDYDGWVDTGDTRWIDEPGNECREKEQRKREYRDYACSDGSCNYTVTETSWGDTGNVRNKPDGTYCGCTANRTLKKCCGGTCSDTGICNSTYCGADSACDGKKPGDTCDANKNCNSACKCQSPEAVFDTGSPENPYPCIWGIHNGTIKPTTTIRVHKLYTYPCPGTGGHSEYVTIWNNSGWNVTAKWKGYGGDWHNIAFEESFTLQAGVEYNYTLVTGSYPQIIHQHEANVTGGAITCTEFVDANGKIYKDYIPAIILS